MYKEMKKLEVKDLKDNFFEAIGKEWMDYSRNKGEVQHYDSKLGWHWVAVE